MYFLSAVITKRKFYLLNFLVFVGCLILSTQLTYAAVNYDPLLNKVTLQLQTEGWATTKTALVDVGVNAAVSDKGIERIQNDVLQQLNQLAEKTTWHIISFNRQEDRSGLESIQIVAQARLPQQDLAALRTKAKNISKPGETYTIDNVQFTPSEEETRALNITLRTNIYNQVKAELEVLNNVYPQQKFYVHQIDFINLNDNQPMPMRANMLAAKSVAAENNMAMPAVGNLQKLQAVVILAAMPVELNQVLKSTP